MGGERLEELLLGVLERRGCHLGLGVGGQGEEVGAATTLAHGVEQSKQVGLGHSGHAQFVAGGRTEIQMIIHPQSNVFWDT